MKKWSFSKLLLLMEGALVLLSTAMGFYLAAVAVRTGFLGSLPWVSAMTTAGWSAYGTSTAFYYSKAKAENTRGGIVYESAMAAPADTDSV